MADLLSAALEVLYILAGAALTLVTAQLLGLTLLHVLDRTLFSGLERVVFGLAVGSACLSSLVFLLCALGIASMSSFLGISAAGALAYLKWGRRGTGKWSLQLHGGLDKLSLWFFGWSCWRTQGSLSSTPSRPKSVPMALAITWALSAAITTTTASLQ